MKENVVKEIILCFAWQINVDMLLSKFTKESVELVDKQ